MAPAMTYRAGFDEGLVLASAVDEAARMHQAAWRHCRFGLKSAPQHRDFRPAKVGVI